MKSLSAHMSRLRAVRLFTYHYSWLALLTLCWMMLGDVILVRACVSGQRFGKNFRSEVVVCC